MSCQLSARKQTNKQTKLNNKHTTARGQKTETQKQRSALGERDTRMSQSLVGPQKQATRPVGVAAVAAAKTESLDCSIIKLLAQEKECGLTELQDLDPDPESIFQEVSRLADSSDMRSVDELLLEAERLIQQQLRLGGLGPDLAPIEGGPATGGTSSSSPQSSPQQHSSIRLNTRYTHRIEHLPSTSASASASASASSKQPKAAGAAETPSRVGKQRPRSGSKPSASPPCASLAQTPNPEGNNGGFAAFVDNLPSESIISEESTPKDLDLDIETHTAALAQLQLQMQDNTDDDEDTMEEITEAEVDAPLRAPPISQVRRRQSYSNQPIRPMAAYSEKGVGSSPKRLVSTLTSPIEQMACSVSREHALKLEIEKLQERLKDTEERLASVRLQSDSLSQTQRTLREQNTRLQDESEMLKLDVQHLNECASVLRAELHAARRDRGEAVQLQKSLRAELEEAQQERRRAGEGKEKDAKAIQDLQRQCREMERILMRKHPDSVSALIVAAKSHNMCPLNDQENLSSRKLLEQRIEQLEADAKEQDRKAQQILANVQARFNSVQSKYETHIADLETQVLSLQEINTKLNEQIESQVRTLDRYMQKRVERYYNNCTQTDPLESDGTVGATCLTTGTQTQAAKGTRDHSTNTIGCPSPRLQGHGYGHQLHPPSASSSTSSTANSTPNTSRPNSKQSVGQRRSPLASAGPSKLPISQSDSTLSQRSHGPGGSTAKEEGQLASSVRNMRVDLALKTKAMQRLTRELDDCKKTIRKLQRDSHTSGPAHGSQPGTKLDLKAQISGGTLGQKRYEHHHSDHIPAAPESQALREAQNKYRLLEADYRTLHDKRLQDLKTLQSAHDRELASSNETVRILQQRLNEREEATQKRRKVPVDYYALKAKVTLLERRHSEREERLHMLVEALSKGRLNGALEDLIQDNNNK